MNTSASALAAPRGLALSSRPWAERLRALLRYAVLAPSVHNSQPWRVRIDNNVLELRPDRLRATPAVDPEARELAISCGAFLFHLRVAARHFGLRADVEIVASTDVCARVVFSEGEGSFDLDSDDLFDAIATRRTVRRAFSGDLVDPLIIEKMHGAAAAEGAHFVVVSANDRAPLARLVSKADEAQAQDTAFLDELVHWSRGVGDDRRDGRRSETAPGAVPRGTPLIIRTFDTGSSRTAHDEDLLAGSPLLAVITTRHDDAAHWLRAGQAVDRVLLTLTAAGLSSSFLNQVVEVKETRARLAHLVNRSEVESTPQIVLRVGRCGRAPPPPTPRRPVDEILDA